MTTPAGVEVRQTTSGDWTLVRLIRLQALRDSPTAFASTYERESAFGEEEWRTRAGSGGCFVASIDGDAVGMAVGYDAPEAAPDSRELVGMWIAPTARRQGVGAALVAAVVDRACADGKRKVGLWVVDGNDAARRLYERMGFVATGDTTPLPHDPSLLERRMTRTL